MPCEDRALLLFRPFWGEPTGLCRSAGQNRGSRNTARAAYGPRSSRFL